jgi:hypothetical protein
MQGSAPHWSQKKGYKIVPRIGYAMRGVRLMLCKKGKQGLYQSPVADSGAEFGALLASGLLPLHSFAVGAIKSAFNTRVQCPGLRSLANTVQVNMHQLYKPVGLHNRCLNHGDVVGSRMLCFCHFRLCFIFVTFTFACA